MTTILRTQRAAVVTGYHKPVEIQTDYPVVAPSDLKANQCLVHVSVSGVCHTDVALQEGILANKTTLPFIGGHEGVGRIAALGPGVVQSETLKVGSRVGIKWVIDTCGRCELCRTGNDTACPEAKTSGTTTNGTFCEYTVVSANHLVPIPDEIEDHIAAPILCAGVTVHKGLKVSNTKIGDWIVIPGAGGGLGHLAVQYAVARGLRVVAIDSGEDKKRISFGLGAEKWIDFKESKDIVKDVVEVCSGLGPHAALIISPIGAAYDDAIKYIRPCGTIVAIGMADATFTLKTSFMSVVGKGIHIVGIICGTLQDAVEALDLVARKKVIPHCHIYDLETINDIFHELGTGKVVGRAVVRI